MPGQPTTPKGNYALLGAIAEAPKQRLLQAHRPRKTVRAAAKQFDAMLRTLARQ